MSNYYFVLGIDKDADIDKIKHAYRFCCKKYHPDLASKEQKDNFLKIREAYETLSDPGKRRIYDRHLEESAPGSAAEIIKTDFMEYEQTANMRMKRFSSLIDEFFEGFVPGFFEDDFSGSKELYCELILSGEEAGHGGDFPIEVPVIEACMACNGKGYAGRFVCSVCSGQGNVRNARSFTLHVPAGVFSGLTAKVPLEGIGLPDAFVNVEVVVNP